MAAAVALIAIIAACDPSGTEEGVRPTDSEQGEVVDLEFDARADRLLRAHSGSLHASYDAGVSWQAVPLPLSVAGGRITDVAARSGAENVIYIAGAEIGIMRSNDDGRTWMSLNAGLPSEAVTSFAVHADQPEILYAFIEDAGMYRSEDAGGGWTRMDSGPGSAMREFLHSGMDGSMQTGWLFAATDEGVRRSMDCFCGWRAAGDLPAGVVHDLAYDPRQAERVYAAAAAGVFVSEDGGESWRQTSANGPAAIAVAVDRSGVLYAAAPDGAVLRSTDLGQSWERPGA